MPTFDGFDGEKFQFEGQPNKFYNLLTDENVQLNAHFNHSHYIDEIGIKLGPTDISWNVKDERPKINNKKLYNRLYFNIDNQVNFGYAQIDFMFEPAPNCLKAKEYVSCLFVCINNYCFTVCKIKNQFKISFNIRNFNVRPHGIVGQTADFNDTPRIPIGKQGEGIIEGNLINYEVTDLWNNNFKYNRFKESV